jgi:hypothetical protein
MSIQLKISLTVAAILVAVVLHFILKPGRHSAGSDCFWRGGRRDLFRAIFFLQDGTARPRARIVVYCILAIWLTLIWLIP